MIACQRGRLSFHRPANGLGVTDPDTILEPSNQSPHDVEAVLSYPHLRPRGFVALGGVVVFFVTSRIEEMNFDVALRAT